MIPNPLTEELSGCPFFSGLEHETLQLLSNCSFNAVFETDHFVFQKDDHADIFYVIRSGRVVVQESTPGRGIVVLQTLGPGDVFGWSWLFPPYRWSFDVRTLEFTDTIGFDGPGIRALSEERKDIGFELMRRFASVVCDRLNATRERMLSMHVTANVPFKVSPGERKGPETSAIHPRI